MKTRINNTRELERRPIQINKNKTKQELLRQIYKIIKNIESVSYTHLDVYKRQTMVRPNNNQPEKRGLIC